MYMCVYFTVYFDYVHVYTISNFPTQFAKKTLNLCTGTLFFLAVLISACSTYILYQQYGTLDVCQFQIVWSALIKGQQHEIL